jgi:hypothetical protein
MAASNFVDKIATVYDCPKSADLALSRLLNSKLNDSDILKNDKHVRVVYSALVGAVFRALGYVIRTVWNNPEHVDEIWEQMQKTRVINWTFFLLRHRREMKKVVDAVFEFYQSYSSLMGGRIEPALLFDLLDYYMARAKLGALGMRLIDRLMTVIRPHSTAELVKANAHLYSQYLLRSKHDPEFALTVAMVAETFLRHCSLEDKAKFALDGMCEAFE